MRYKYMQKPNDSIEFPCMNPVLVSDIILQDIKRNSLWLYGIGDKAPVNTFAYVYQVSYQFQCYTKLFILVTE